VPGCRAPERRPARAVRDGDGGAGNGAPARTRRSERRGAASDRRRPPAHDVAPARRRLRRAPRASLEAWPHDARHAPVPPHDPASPKSRSRARADSSLAHRCSPRGLSSLACARGLPTPGPAARAASPTASSNPSGSSPRATAPAACSSSSSAAPSPWWRRTATAPAGSTSSDRTRAQGSAACWGWRSTRSSRERAAVRPLHGPRRRHGALRAPADPAAAASTPPPRSCCSPSTSPTGTTTAVRSRSVPTAPLPRRSATAAAAATRWARARTSARRSVRCCVSTSTPAAPAPAVPSDNPFVDVAGARPEIWAYGLRNPWRFSFDARTGDLWIADVGQNAVEEVNLQRAGAARAGPTTGGASSRATAASSRRSGCDPDRLRGPGRHLHARLGWGRSITGGVVPYGDAAPSLRGRYLFGDFVSGRVFVLTDGSGRLRSGTAADAKLRHRLLRARRGARRLRRRLRRRGPVPHRGLTGRRPPGPGGAYHAR
jgi:hypothetical protein